MKKTLLILATIMVFPAVAHAAGVFSGSGVITRLDQYGNGYTVVGLDLSANPAGCSNLASATQDPNLSDEQRRLIDSTLLAAFLSGKPARIKMRDNTCDSADRPVYYAVRLSN